MGFDVKERCFGFYQRQADADRVRATIRHLQVGDVSEFIEDLRRYSGEDEIRFYVDDRRLDRRIGPALVKSGCDPEMTETYLAHTNGMPILSHQPENLSFEEVNEDTIEEAVRVECKGFSNSESEPETEYFRRRLILRKAEMKGQGRFLLARIDGEPASVLGFYEGYDRYIFNLATRLPLRGQGVASRLILEVIANGREHGCRSIIISADENGRPASLYRYLGFTDEVYWRREYRHARETKREVP